MNIKLSIKERVESVRIRTWFLTATLLVALTFYYLVTVIFEGEINWVDFIVLAVSTILMHLIYFPDGKLYGEKNPTFIANKTAYNEKATAINEKQLVGQLREYCKVDYEERKKEYFKSECDSIGITAQEYDALKQVPLKKLKKLEQWEFEGKMLNFTETQRERLQKLIYEPCPVEPNKVETIMSAKEYNGKRAIKDTSIVYEQIAHFKKVFQAFTTGLVLSFIGYKLRESVDLTTIAAIAILIVSLSATAVLSYTSGETSTTVHKNNFYLDLSNFLDKFFEWNAKNS